MCRLRAMRLAESVNDMPICRIAQSRLCAVPHSVESTIKFCIEFHVELHGTESAMKFFVKTPRYVA
jgi:hypothetical protein